ncbi:hypothetical protein H4696_009793 [Amycolatopsis lexingtonensis]|uniref:Uncharacterized protein n=1 Tax=Amycolatopsis lexingtonensis TaxID=218822 RepID=A0ABR9IHN4_9PSEU|nr:hypothetical protein [Amycolatopsis lexingtonensis]MBE1502693.1 hypothetical protein [Amycolatopsis lexingtonensis]
MTTRETWPCADCGHCHYASQECADHPWTDWCPYEGLDCPPDVKQRRAAAEAELLERYGPNPTLDELLPPAED